tara:strand:- start:4013 stop:4249 length:237 start_codon:yes stop_codon:yes gene_type:complete
MAFTVNVKITAPVGADSGPCDIYQNGDLYTTPVATGVSISSLTSPAGVDVGVNQSTTILKVQNTGTCTNFENVAILFT